MIAQIRIKRRKFLAWGLSAFFVSLISPWCSGCRSRKQQTGSRLWNALADTLFPGTPDIRQTGFYHHLQFVLNDENYDPDIRMALLDGFTDFQAYIKIHSPDFSLLPLDKRTAVLEQYIQTKAGAENWLSRVLTVIWESALLDPHYGINHQESGWKWLQHIPGHPRPDNKADYAALLKKRKQSQHIRHL